MTPFVQALKATRWVFDGAGKRDLLDELIRMAGVLEARIADTEIDSHKASIMRRIEVLTNVDGLTLQQRLEDGEHDRKYLGKLEEMFEAVGPDLIEAVVTLNSRYDELKQATLGAYFTKKNEPDAPYDRAILGQIEDMFALVGCDLIVGIQRLISDGFIRWDAKGEFTQFPVWLDVETMAIRHDVLVAVLTGAPRPDKEQVTLAKAAIENLFAQGKKIPATDEGAGLIEETVLAAIGPPCGDPTKEDPF